MEDRLISTAEASSITGVSVHTIHYWMKELKSLPSIKIGGRHLVKLSDVKKANELSVTNYQRHMVRAR